MPDLRSPARRYGDAFAELLTGVLDGGGLPTEGGERPHVTVTVALETLQRRLGDARDADLLGSLAAELGTGAALSAEAARRVACDARVLPVVLGQAGEPLDVGRASYTVPAGLRRALVARDRGCAFPGCDRPPTWCHAHHITHWSHGGATALGNLVLLCAHHHRVVHHQEWDVRIGEDGHPEFTPPPWVPLPAAPPPWRTALRELLPDPRDHAAA